MFVFDGVTVASTTQYPFDTDWFAENAKAGPHTLKVVAMDTQNVSVIQEIPFILDLPLEPASIDWFDKSPLTVQTVQYPRLFNITPYRWDNMRDVKIYLRTGENERLIYTFTQGQDKLANGQLGFTWKKSPVPGEYVLRAVMTDVQGQIVEKMLTVIVP